MIPLYSCQLSADHLLDKLQFGLGVQFFNLSSCAECWFLLRKLAVMVWAGVVLTPGPAWLWVNNLSASIWFDGLPLIQIYGVGTRAKSTPHLQQGSLTPIPVPCRKNPSLLPRVQNFPISSHKECHKAPSDSCVVSASPFQSSLLIMFVWKCLKWL